MNAPLCECGTDTRAGHYQRVVTSPVVLLRPTESDI